MLDARVVQGRPGTRVLAGASEDLTADLLRLGASVAALGIAVFLTLVR
jgi:hypothetical protein